MNAVCSILKFIGPIKIDISKQKPSDQLLISKSKLKRDNFPARCLTNINKPPLCYILST